MTMRHGTATMATTGRCSCRPCRDAQTRYVKHWRLARERGHTFMVPSEPTRRKIRALARLGHTFTDVAREAGYAGPAAITNLMTHDVIRAKTEVRLEEAYRRLEMVVPPTTPERAKVQRRAVAEGWLAPLAYDDIQAGIVAETEVVAAVPHNRFDLDEVETFLQYGDWKRRLSRLEKIEVVRRWTREGRSEASLCRLTGWKEGRYRFTDTTHQEAS